MRIVVYHRTPINWICSYRRSLLSYVRPASLPPRLQATYSTTWARTSSQSFTASLFLTP